MKNVHPKHLFTHTEQQSYQETRKQIKGERKKLDLLNISGRVFFNNNLFDSWSGSRLKLRAEISNIPPDCA